MVSRSEMEGFVKSMNSHDSQIRRISKDAAIGLACRNQTMSGKKCRHWRSSHCCDVGSQCCIHNGHCSKICLVLSMSAPQKHDIGPLM